ncbi:MAG: hypothetical protein MHM6MM_008379 [Cercozoa sp. M6MM]
MLRVLAPMHAKLEKGPTTMREVAFQQRFARDLREARKWCSEYERTGAETHLNQAWNLYVRVFKQIDKQLPQLAKQRLELQYVSPLLMRAADLALAVPGTYTAAALASANAAAERRRHADELLLIDGVDDTTVASPRHESVSTEVVRIQRFEAALRVIDSKQRPRKLRIHGSDGRVYSFLLKGHEDLRQDERVMQLFGLVNTLLRTAHGTRRRDLRIRRYAIIPLAHDSGLIEWMSQCDTVASLVRSHRTRHRRLLNVEHRLVLQASADYDRLRLMQKVEVFRNALAQTSGDDMCQVMWQLAPSAQTWLERRTNYTRSLAVMSMVGYVLGLGDRHPCNIMLDRRSGKLIHIDFGDCFEVAMERHKFPEKVPFRLTRMLAKAMGVAGVQDGDFRSTCSSVMHVMRQNASSIMAVLEAFVHDPLVNWRLANPEAEGEGEEMDVAADELPMSLMGPTTPNAMATASTRDVPTGLRVIQRVSSKLTGRDFGAHMPLDVNSQVDALIEWATSAENLCQCYIGWCPLW